MKTNNAKLIDRSPVASGRFYSAHANKLEAEIADMIIEAQNLSTYSLKEEDEILALIAPHAGYVFSGVVAASAFMQLKHIKPCKTVFLIGSSHHTDFNGASIYNLGHYHTPFGKVKVNLDIANKLIEESDIINFVQVAHAHEHSIEVMLPLIQYFWSQDFEIVPIIIATHDIEICKSMAKLLQPYFSKENLFVISTDLSHYPCYTDAIDIDKKTIQATISGNPNLLLQQIKDNDAKNISNLATSMCGWTSVLILQYLCEEHGNTSFSPILYQNSGDAKLYGDNDRVVGYQSVIITTPKIEKVYQLSNEEKNKLIEVAKESIMYYSLHNTHDVPSLEKLSENLKSPGGAFVSVYYKGELKGCIGRMHSDKTPLIHIVSDVAVSAAFHDTRFTKLSKEELKNAQIEISVLTPLRKIRSIEEIELGRHGIYIKKDFHTGTFLPQVANKTDWSVEEFVSNCSKNKAGIGADGWKTAELFTYEAIIFQSE